jgi:hypothetical protein
MSNRRYLAFVALAAGPLLGISVARRVVGLGRGMRHSFSQRV